MVKNRKDDFFYGEKECNLLTKLFVLFSLPIIIGWISHLINYKFPSNIYLNIFFTLSGLIWMILLLPALYCGGMHYAYSED